MNNFHIRDDFRAGAPISQVPASWFNAVASFINNLVGGYGIRIVKNQRGPSTVEIDESYMHKQTDTATTFPQVDAPTATLDVGNVAPSAHSGNYGLALSNAGGWTRGQLDASNHPKGVRVYLPTDSWTTANENCLAWRLCTFDGEGRLLSIGNQTILTYACCTERVGVIESQL